MNPGVYAVRNIETGEMYVGSSLRMQKRWRNHGWACKRHRNPCTLLQIAWDRYGEDAFEFIVIEPISDIRQLKEREQFWIEHYNSHARGYNSHPRAESPVGMKRSAQTRARMSEVQLGHGCSDETKAKIGAKSRLKVMSAETKAKVSAFQKGRPKSPEMRAKLSATRKVMAAKRKAALLVSANTLPV